MIKVDNIKLGVSENLQTLKLKACKKAKVNPDKIKYFKVLKKSLDARDKTDIHFVYSVELDFKIPQAEKEEKLEYDYPKDGVVVIGSGPSGLFCALLLARQGFKPLLLERGMPVDERQTAIEDFYKTGKLNANTNIQFGEGGAGTFSDGKLNTGVKSEYKKFILKEFVKHGAPEEIEYDGKPHIGSDKLPSVIKSIREEIISLGGTVRFNALVTGLEIVDGVAVGLTVNGEKIKASEIVLAIGHSARDTYLNLINQGVYAETKDTAVGVRIEHLQSEINKAQYGKKNVDLPLPPADYKLTANANGRGVFTFCMCPGGFVVGAISEENGVVTNGMSNYLRDGINANSAVVVQVRKEDYGNTLLGGIEFLRDLESKAYNATNSYKAPVQLFGDFCKGKVSKCFNSVKPTYPLGTQFCDLNKILPPFISESLKIGITEMDKKLRGFANYDAVLTGVETRTSSPVRFTRGEDMQSINVKNLYPSGETGYAGGIMSASIDGIKTAKAIMKKYEKSIDNK